MLGLLVPMIFPFVQSCWLTPIRTSFLAPVSLHAQSCRAVHPKQPSTARATPHCDLAVVDTDNSIATRPTARTLCVR